MKNDKNLARIDKKTGSLIGTDKMMEKLDQNDSIAGRVLLKERHWMMRIFPDRADIERAKYEAQLVQLQAKSEYDLIKMHKEAMKQAFKEALDTLLINGKTKTRKERAEFFTYNAEELQNNIDEIRTKFMDRMEKRLDRLATIRNDRLRQREEDALMTSIDHFYESIDKMIKNFHAIVDEGV